MTTGIRRKTQAIALLASLSLMSGCLMKEEDSAAEPADNGVLVSSGAPSISGTPQAAVKMGDSYSFQPSAADPDGDPLTFTVQNLPTWASFDTATGTISGQPSLANVGVFENIVITVSDGSSSASLPAFDITVTQVQLGSMTLSWTPPTENTDGSALTDLAGYRIYYGLSEGNYRNRVEINTAGIATYVVENLIPDTYYVVATSVNAAGVESAFSNVAVKTVL